MKKSLHLIHFLQHKEKCESEGVEESRHIFRFGVFGCMFLASGGARVACLSLEWHSGGSLGNCGMDLLRVHVFGMKLCHHK